MNFIKTLFLFFSITWATISTARTVTAKATGNWGSTTTWNPAIVPVCGDTIIIPASYTVTVDAVYDYASGACASKPICIIVSGELYFTNNHELDLATGSNLYIENGGTVASQNHGSNTFITINGVTEWTGNSQGSTTGVSGVVSISSGGIITPIQLLTFTVLPQNGAALINWATASEANNKYFTIEKSTDGANFNVFTTVNSKAQNGNSTATINYQTIDENPANGISYYRLKQTDYNGQYKYFTMAPVYFTEIKNNTFMATPNPCNGYFTLQTTNQTQTLQIFDQTGNPVLTESINGTSLINVSTLTNGIYTLSLIGNSNTQNKKLVIIK